MPFLFLFPPFATPFPIPTFLQAEAGSVSCRDPLILSLKACIVSLNLTGLNSVLVRIEPCPAFLLCRDFLSCIDILLYLLNTQNACLFDFKLHVILSVSWIKGISLLSLLSSLWETPPGVLWRMVGGRVGNYICTNKVITKKGLKQYAEY